MALTIAVAAPSRIRERLNRIFLQTRVDIHKTIYELLKIIICEVVPYLETWQDFLSLLL
jgi:hypothetical protein